MEVVNTTSTVDPINMYDTLNTFLFNPVVFIILFLIIIAYLILFSSLGNNKDVTNGSNNDNNGNESNIMGIIIIVILILLILVNAFQYFFSVNVSAYVKGLFTKNKEIDIVIDQTRYQPSSVPEIKFRKQVFNIPGNYYNYENAKALCQAYGSDLATYTQIENSYKKGGEWCNYGWSDGQMALFPTQQNTFNNLQNIKGHEHDCGRPGINGGYIANPEVRFGVNCYGNKPRITDEEEDMMKNATPYPETMEESAFQKRVDFWKNQVDEILVSPFNYNSWGQL
jgi:hypothetical protein